MTHCPKMAIARLEAQPNFETNREKKDPVSLLIMLQDISQAHKSTKNKTIMIVESDMNLTIRA